MERSAKEANLYCTASSVIITASVHTLRITGAHLGAAKHRVRAGVAIVHAHTLPQQLGIQLLEVVVVVTPDVVSQLMDQRLPDLVILAEAFEVVRAQAKLDLLASVDIEAKDACDVALIVHFVSRRHFTQLAHFEPTYGAQTHQDAATAAFPSSTNASVGQSSTKHSLAPRHPKACHTLATTSAIVWKSLLQASVCPKMCNSQLCQIL